MTSYLRRLPTYLGELREELRRLDAYRPDAPVSAYPRAARAFLEMAIPAGQAAARLAARVGPSAAGLLAAEDVTPARWSQYAEHLLTHASQLNRPEHALEWILAGVPAADAASWADLGYLPAEAGSLIAEGVTPAMAALGQDLSEDPQRDRGDMRTDTALHDELLRRDDLIIDPDLADRLGLDPGRNPRDGVV